MTIIHSEGGTIVTGDDIKLFQKMAWKHALHLEMLGMSRRGRSVYSIVKSELGFKGNKQKVYEQLVDHIEELTRARD